MTARDFDVGPLTWVKGEIEQALVKAGEALAGFINNPLDTAQLKFCKTHLHQAHGALEIVALDGVTKLTEESEKLISAVEEGTISMSEPVAQALIDTFSGVAEYLNELTEGEPHQPLRLFAQYKAVMQARGAERILETDLFYPDLSVKPPKRDVASLPPDMREHVLKQRRRFQTGLLRWLRNAADHSALSDMLASVKSIEKTQALPQHRAFWWITIGFIETLIEAGANSGLEAKRLCARIDLQMKRLMDGSQNVAERLMRDALFFVARGQSDGGEARKIRALYGLEGAVPASASRKDIRPHEATLRTVRDILALAKDKWNKFSAGQTHELSGFKEQAGLLKEKSASLENPDFAKLVNAISQVTMWVAENPSKVTEPIALETATALLLAENAAENFVRLTPEFPAQVNAMGMRLKASLAGEVPPDAPDVSMLDEISRKAQERLLMAQVVAEIKSNLGTIESTLDGFFREPAKRNELPALEGQVRQVQGALTIMGADKAVVALAQCGADIKRFAAEDYVPEQADFERVAETMSGLGFFVEALQHGPADFDALMKPVSPNQAAAAQEVEPEPALDDSLKKAPSSSDEALTVEAELELERKDARALFDAWRVKPADSVMTAELTASLNAIKQDADLVDDPQLMAQAKRVLDLIAEGRPEAMADIAQAMNLIAPSAAPAVVVEMVAAPETQALAAAPAEEVDAELLAIFLEEAQEVIGTVGGELVKVRAEPSNREVLTTLRRAFHTLKGSGRMVGLMRFGDAAWSVEQTMNDWLQAERPVGAPLLDLIGAAHDTLGRWINELANGGASSIDGAPLIAAAEAVRAGGAFAMGGAATAATAVTAGDDPAVAAAAAMGAVGAAGAMGVIGAAGAAGALAAVVSSVAEPTPSLAEIVPEAPALTVPSLDAMDLPDLNLASAPGTIEAISIEMPADVDLDLGSSAEAAAPAPKPPFDTTVVIGDIRVSPSLYNIFVEEADTHLHAMKKELVLLADEPQPPRDEFIRAVHTIAGIAGTVNFKKLNELGRAYERVLIAARNGAVLPTEADLELGGEAITAMEEMVDAVKELRPPPSADGLEMKLEVRRNELLNAAGDADEPSIMSVIEAAQPPEVAPSSDMSAEVISGLDIDFGSDEPTSQLTDSPPAIPIADLMPEPQISFEAVPEPEATVLPPADDGFTFEVQDITLPKAESAPEMPTGTASSADAPRDAQDLTMAFLGDKPAAPAPKPQLPDLGEMTMLVAATGALGAVGIAAANAATTAAAAKPAALAESPSTALPMGASQNELSFATSESPEPARDPINEEILLARGFDSAERREERIEDEIDDQLLPIFMEEANDLVPQVGAELRAWSANPKDSNAAAALQRSLHTLKGSARMAGAMAIGQLTHSMETRLENALALPQVPAPIVDGLMTSYDRVGTLMDGLRTYDPSKKAELAATAQAMLDEDATRKVEPLDPAAFAAAPAAFAATAASLEKPSQTASPAPAADSPQARAAEDARAVLRVRADLIDRFVNEAGEVAIARSRIEGEVRAVKGSLKDLTENVLRLRTQLREIEIAAETQIQSRQREAEEKHASFDPLEFDRFSRFQELTRMMAESVNDVATVQQNLLKSLDDTDAALLAQGRLNRDLQNDLMRVRMVPFNNVAERLYRVVRQTAKEVGKRANLDIRGTQTEIDRSVLERMTGPFEHLLRNAISHGLEDGAGRARAGKADIGEIMLTAKQEGNEFVLVFEDDGAGLNIARIREKAIANGLMRETDALSDDQIAEFIFAAGFSTATEVSAISGRGVGMDVVRAEVAALGGRVDVTFTPGRGTRFTIFLPLTLAVTQVVLVRTGSTMFAVPSAMVEQVRQTRAEDLSKAYARQAYEWQGRDYALFYLPRLLGDIDQAAEAQRFTPVLLLRSGAQRAAVHVDEMLGNQEVVVKNIGPQLARVSGIAGATVLGNGQIVLILNPVPLAQMAMASAVNLSSDDLATAPKTMAVPTLAAPSVLPVSSAPTVMVVDDSLTVRKITSRLLARENYQVVTAKDGVDALEQLQDLRPDVMLVDIEMPRMDGFDLTRNVRADEALKKIPIIMITSRTAEKHRNYAMEIGVNVFLGKPYQEEELLEQIAYLTKNVGREATAPA